MATRKKTGGRGSGTPNKISGELKDRIQLFLDGKWSDIERDFKKLEPKDRLLFYERLMKYVIPTMQATKNEISFEALNDEQLDQIIRKIMNNETIE